MTSSPIQTLMQMASSIKLAQLNELTEGEVFNTPDPPGETGTLALTDGEVLVETDALALSDGDRLGDAVDEAV